MTMTTEQIIQRIIDQEIYVDASTLVQELISGLTLNSASFAELWPECLEPVDYDTPVTEAVAEITPAGLFFLCEELGINLYTKTGVVVEDDDAADLLDFDSLDRDAVLDEIRGENQLQDAADYLGLEPHYDEALQHWLVSDWLADKLEQVGAPIARDVLGFNVWGRTECGQSLTMDAALHRVAAIIEGA